MIDNQMAFIWSRLTIRQIKAPDFQRLAYQYADIMDAEDMTQLHQFVLQQDEIELELWRVMEFVGWFNGSQNVREQVTAFYQQQGAA